MVLMCYVCRRKASKGDRISLHKFPKNPILRNRWIKACNLSPSDDLTYIYICSVHFHTDNIDRGNGLQSRCTLKNNAVPSVGKPNTVPFNNKNMDTLNNGAENNTKSSEVEPTNTFNNQINNANHLYNVMEDANTFYNVTNNVDTSDNVVGNIHVQELQSPTHVSHEGDNDENFEKCEESCYTTPKRRIFEPRCISEIKTSDFETPKRNRIILNFVRDTVIKKTKLIKSLQARNRRLEKRISSLREIISHLTKEKYVSNGIGDTLLI